MGMGYGIAILVCALAAQAAGKIDQAGTGAGLKEA